MVLSSDLISRFVKATNDSEKTTKTPIIYGTIVDDSGKKYVQLDGSDVLTPMSSTTVVENGDRVIVEIKNHTAIVVGNVTNPSASDKNVQQIGSKVSEFEVVIADKVSTGELEAEKARIDELVADNVFVKEKLTAAEADIGELTAENATITGKLEAAEADIENLHATKIDADIVEATYATIENLEATNLDVRNLEADFGDFEQLATDKFEAVDATIENLDVTYATIDFANINLAAVEKLFVDSGIIKDLVVSEGHITGELVGVTIKGDLIEGGTVIADKLVVKGSDGLYYKLNTDGVTTEAEQTEYNSLNGSVITAKSITATKIAVDDLVAFDATIGGFQITDDSIHTVLKESVDSPYRGIYLDNSGQMAIGDSANYLKYYKDQNGDYKLEISAKSIAISTTGENLEDVISDMQDATDSAIVSSVEEFYRSDSPTELTGGEWSLAQPVWMEGKFIWRRTKITYGNGSSEYSPSENGVCITGNTGANGQDGQDSIFLQILSSNGNLFKNSTLATTLTVTIIVADEMITSSQDMYAKFGDNASLKWEQKIFGSEEFTDLPSDDSRLSDNGFILTLQPDDVYTQTVFNCRLEY